MTTSRGKGWLIIGAVLLAGWAISSRHSDHGDRSSSTSTPSPSAAASPSPAPHVPQIAQGAADPYTKDQYPKTFKNWGSAGVKRINEVRALAAPIVAAYPACDRLELIELSDNRSKPKDTIVLFADCTNGQRFYITEAEARAGAAVLSQQQKSKDFDKQAMIEQCTVAVKRRLTIPDSLDRDYWTIGAWQAQGGNWVIQFDFTAKNALGVELPAKAKCIVTPEREMDVQVIEG